MVKGKSNSVKRPFGDLSASSEEEEEEEQIPPAQKVQAETPQSGNPTSGEAMEEEAIREAVPQQPSSQATKPLPSTSAAPLAAASPALPGKAVKGGVNAGSSGPPGDKRSAVSTKKAKKISIITGPNHNKWK